MVIDSAAYLLSLCQFYLCITLLMFVFPLFTWRSYLKRKSMIFRFLFCALTQSCFVANLVLLLGWLKIANRWTLLLGLAVEYAVVRWKTHGLSQTIVTRRPHAVLERPLTREGCRAFVTHELLDIRLRLSKFRSWPIWGWLRKHWLPLTILLAFLVYNCYFLNHNMLTDGHCYQFSDCPVHTSWSYALDHGTLFVAGIYPFYMHGTIYAIAELFGIHLREVILYYGPYQTLLLLCCMYCVGRKFFSNEYVAFFPLMIFSLLMNNGRYAGTLPQECGMFSAMAMAYFLSSYLQSNRERHTLATDSRLKSLFRINQFWFRRYMTIDLLLIAICVGNVIGFHFYTAIAAIFMVIGFAVAYLPRLLNKHYWLPLLTAGILGAVIAITPFIACLAQGIPFQQSMNWAMSLISGDDWVNEEQASYQSLISDTPEETTAPEVPTPANTEENAIQPPITLQHIYLSLTDTVLYSVPPHNMMTAYVLFALLGFTTLAYIGMAFIPKQRWIGADYFAFAFFCLTMLILGSSAALRLPQLVERQRISVFIQPYLFILCAVPIDVLCRIISALMKNRFGSVLTSLLATAACLAIAALCISTGTLHHYFDLNRAYYNEAEYVLKSIRKNFPAQSFIVVSPTDDYYGVVDEGYHTEISELIGMIEGNCTEFSLPAKYAFIFVEKHLMQDFNYGQVNVSPEYAQDQFIYTGSSQDYFYQRAVLESKAYYWAQCMLDTYPDAFSVYFEDDIFVAYLLQQNPNYPYDLRVDFTPYVERALAEKAEAEAASLLPASEGA